MKKNINVLLASILLGCLALTACNHVNNTADTAFEQNCLTPAALTQAEQDFAQNVAPKYGVRTEDALLILSQVHMQQSIIRKMTTPSEKKAWGDYRSLLLTPQRIAAGKAFIHNHAAVFAEAKQRYGVSPEMIGSIIGIETFYGKNLGSYRVVDALATLSFEYPKRAAFFQKELAEYMSLIVKDPEYLKMKGSYAGASGLAQFMPSAYLSTAVCDVPGKVPNLYLPDDAILSIAHYFAMNGWQSGGLIAVRVKLAAKSCNMLTCNEMKPLYSVAEWRRAGVQVPADISNNLRASVVQLHMDDGPEAWMVFHNFYVITRYNKSINYAMAAFELSQALR